MTWSGSEILYEGFRLMLRKPNHINIWKLKDEFPQLVCIEHLLDKVNPDGLPEKEYNSSIAEFDHYMCSIFDESNQGIIFLVETYCGKRSYYYFTKPSFKIQSLVDIAKQKFEVNIECWEQDDTNWGFLNAYPVKLYKE